MANIISKSTGSKAIQVVLGDGSRRSIGIGKLPKKAAESYRIQIEHLVGASIGGYSIPPMTAEWLTTISQRLRRRLEDLSLVAPLPVDVDKDITLGVLVERYLGDLDVKDRTITRYKNQIRFMRDFLGDHADIKQITCGDGDRFHRWLKHKKKQNGKPLAPNYIHKIVKTSRQVFAYAMADKLIDNNPFEDVKAPEQISDDRDFEISPVMTEKILKAASPKYTLISALARYAGLRCPSELAGLRWSDFVWDQDRFVVHSPKTEHCGKTTRVVPIFSELRPYIDEAFDATPDGQDKVLPDIDEDSNLRTETLRILKRAGIADAVPRFYQNCRSSRQTELEAKFPLHVVCKWLGNSERTARKHYLKVREADFEKASSGMHESMQSSTATCGNEPQSGNSKHQKTPREASSPALALCSEYTRRDSNPQPWAVKNLVLQG